MNFYKIISSRRLMAVLMAIFTIAIAIATFIENDFDRDSAFSAVYRAKWFELILFIGMINIIGVTIRFKLYERQKLTILLFHLSFIVILLGSVITRYIGFEGTMHIREGSDSEILVTEKTYINIKIDSEDKIYSYPVFFSALSRNRFSKSIKTNKGRINLKVVDVVPNAEKTLEYDAKGQAVAHFVTGGRQGRITHMLFKGEELDVGNITLLFDSPEIRTDSNFVKLLERDGVLYFSAPFEVNKTMMSDQSQEKLAADSIHPFLPMTLYNFRDHPVVLRTFLPAGKITVNSSDNKDAGFPDAVKLLLSDGRDSKEIILTGQKDLIGQPLNIILSDNSLTASYGSNIVKLPFKIRLIDFILDRYPGSDSPSWYESKVELVDDEKNIKKVQRIYMNHILKHRGYRFYQASYDQDESGTILSVNYDWFGTFVTYLGYLLMAAGMIMSLLNPNSRFRKLAGKPGGIALKTIMLIILLNIKLITNISANDSLSNPNSIPAEHAEEFGKILVLDNGGRIKPVYTLASEVLSKVSRKTEIENQNTMQVFLGLLTWPAEWQNKPMIRVGHKEIINLLAVSDNYASFNDFFTFDGSFGYKLRPYVEEANRKKPAQRSKFDNEIIRVDERVNILFLTFSGGLLKIFPNKDDKRKWYSPQTAPGNFSAEDSVFVNHILNYYLSEVRLAAETNDWNRANELQKSFLLFQDKYGGELLPSESKVNLEIFYYKSNILNKLSNYYLLIGFLLLIIQFLNIFFSRIPIRWPTIAGGSIIIILFALHAVALGIRWYVSGHAPWSNGYEALTYIAWVTILAGLIFSGKSGISISVTALLSGLILHTAHLSWMDPQITNLVPVLKSYWLIIHVAVITASYAFAGLGALLALFNLFLMFFESRKNKDRVDSYINQLSGILEMTLTIAIFLLTIGTFLGGIWANESWGRYWGWDPKETWALVTIIVYAFILHMRLVPGLRGMVIFNIFGLFGFASIIMTYFGVNYYLSGLHSYAKGDPAPIPPIVLYTVVSLVIISALAAINQYQINKVSNKV